MNHITACVTRVYQFGYHFCLLSQLWTPAEVVVALKN